MNIVIRTTGTVQRHVASVRTWPRINIPFYFYLPLWIAFVVLVILIVWMILVRQDLRASPFFTHHEILPGQPYSSVLTQGFSCGPDHHREYCTRRPTSGAFALISIIFRDGVVKRTNFSVRENMLSTGELVLLWGRPKIHLYRQSVTLEWPEAGIRATAWAENGHFRYFIPVQGIAFSSNSLQISTSSPN